MIKSIKCLDLCILSISFLLLVTQSLLAGTSYDPLAVSARFTPETVDLAVHDAERKREIPIRVCLPSGKSPAPVVLFSHGLGGSRVRYTYLGNHWAARGYVAVFLHYSGSETAARKDNPMEQRVKDIPAVLDQLDRWNKSPGHILAGRLNLTRVGMSGHSLGAVTAQAVSGQSFAQGKFSYTDPRIKAAIALSPDSPRRGGDAKQAFGSVKIPWMLMTGTKDFANDANLNSRLAVFTALPPGGKYEIVFYGAEHSVFTDRAQRGEMEKRNSNYHRAILALSTAFWDTCLRDDGLAGTWLDGDGPRSVLAKNDRWQKK